MLLLLTACGRGSYAPSHEDWADSAGYDPFLRWTRDVGRAVEFAPLGTSWGWFVVVTDNQLVCLDPDSGARRFKSKLAASPSGPPLLCGGRLITATDYPRPRLTAWDPATGKKVWELKRSVQSMTAVADTLYSLEDPPGLTAVLATSGDALWSRSLRRAGPYGPVSVDSLLLVPVRPDSVVAVSRVNGTRRWARAVGWTPFLSVDGDQVLAACADSVLVILDAHTGVVRGRRDLPGRPVGPVVVADGGRFLATTDGVLLRLGLQGDASSLWEARIPPPVLAVPVPGESLVALAGPRGRVYLFDPGTGREVERVRHPERILAAPAMWDRTLLLGGSGGTVNAYRETP